MTTIYITKVQIALGRVLSASERDTAARFFQSGYSVSYAVEYLK